MSLTLSDHQAEELFHLLAGLMNWLTFADRDLLGDLDHHLRVDAFRNGGPLEDLGDDTLAVFIDFIDTYTTVLDGPSDR